MNTVKKERPEHAPVLARGSSHDVEVCIMPNGCFTMLFEKGDKQKVEVKECSWEYVEGKVSSGVEHMVAIYAHEGVTVADSIARGKRDAIRDIRSLEDSGIAKAVTQLEKILQGMTGVEHANRTVAEVGEQELAKLKPIKEAIASSGPGMDMLRIVDSLKHYPGIQTTSKSEFEAKKLLEDIVKDLGDLADIISRVESQDQKLEELEQALKKALTELNRNMDERIAKGLAVILSASDKKIDKGFAALAGRTSKDVMFELPRELETRLENMEKEIKAAKVQIDGISEEPVPDLSIPADLEQRLERLDKTAAALQAQIEAKLSEKPADDAHSPKVHEELVVAVAKLNEDIARINNRIIKIEEFLAQATARASAPRVRTLKPTQQQ